MIHRVCILQYRIIFPFHLAKQINYPADPVDTERYDIVRFSKVTTKSLASGAGS